MRLSRENILEWRKQFPTLETKIHCGNCSQGPQAVSVRAAVERYLDNWQNVAMDWDSWTDEVETARAQFAQLIGAEAGEVAVVSSVSHAVAAILGALPQDRSRTRLLTTQMDFPTVGQILIAHQPKGVEFIELAGDEITLEQYESKIGGDTQLVMVPHTYYETGYRQDIAAIAKLCNSKGAMIAVDAYQGMGTCDINVKELNIDFLYSGNLKYLLGVPGIAFLYVSSAIIDMLSPRQTGWFGQREPFAFKLRELDYATGARRFDTGTPPVMAAYAAAAGMKIIAEVGAKNIEERIAKLNRIGSAKADKLDLNIAGSRDIAKRGANIAVLPRTDPHKLERQLAAQGIICSARGRVLRCAPHFFTLEEELEQVLETVAKLDK